MHKLSKVFEKILYWAVLGLILFIPLFLKFPLIGVKGTFVSVRSEDILIAATYFLWGIYILISGKVKFLFKDRLNQALLVFFAIGFISLVSAATVTHTVTLQLGLLHFLRRIEVIMLLPVAYSIIKTKRQAYFYIGALAIVVALVNIYALGQRYLGFPAISTINSELSKGLVYYIKSYDRVVSTFGGHYDLAVFLVMALSIFSGLFFYLLNAFPLTAVLVTLLACVSAVVLVMTAARLSFFAAITGIIAGLILSGKKKFIIVVLVLMGIVLVYPSQLRDRLVSTITVNLKQSWNSYFSSKDKEAQRTKLNIPTLPLTWEQRQAETEATKSANATVSSDPISADIVPGEPVNSTDLGVYRSFDIRVRAEWPRAIRALTKNPLLGTGYSSIGLATDNDLLRSFGEVGILGTLAFLFILIEVTKRIVKIFKNQTGFNKYLAAGVLAMVIAFMVNGMFIDVFEASKTASLFWLILGITLALGKSDIIES